MMRFMGCSKGKLISCSTGVALCHDGMGLGVDVVTSVLLEQACCVNALLHSI